MEYELCKKLKDAGFPQEYKKTKPLIDCAFDEKRELHLLHKDNDTDWWIGNNYNHSNMSIEEVQKNWVKSPTLSELIKECGKDFGMLFLIDQKWGARMRPQDITNAWKITIFYDSSPKKAVTKLWLSLNNK